MVLIYAQLSPSKGLRGLVMGFNASRMAITRLNLARPARSTLSDANARRPVGVFAQTFAMLAERPIGKTRREGAAVVRLIDASPIPLGKVCQWAKWNGRIRGMKMHVVYDPRAMFHCVEVTPANVNDVEIGRKTEIEAGTTYVFDKGYCRFDWWTKINNYKALFVTRTKVNMRLRATKSRYVRKTIGDGFKIISDADVVLASKGNSSLPIPLRRIKVRRGRLPWRAACHAAATRRNGARSPWSGDTTSRGHTASIENINECSHVACSVRSRDDPHASTPLIPRIAGVRRRIRDLRPCTGSSHQPLAHRLKSCFSSSV